MPTWDRKNYEVPDGRLVQAGPWQINLDPAVVVPKNYDVRVRAETSANNLVVFTSFQ